MIDNRKVSSAVLASWLRLGDLLAIVAAGLIAYWLRFEGMDFRPRDWPVFIAVTFAAANIFHFCKLYDPQRIIARPYDVQRLLLAGVVLVLVTLAAGYLTKTSSLYSRSWLAMWAVGGLALLLVLRVVLALRLARWQADGWLTRRVAVVGAGPEGQALIAHRSRNPDPSISLVGVFDDRRDRVPKNLGEVPVRGNLATLLRIVGEEKIDEVIVALPWSAVVRLETVMARLRTVPVDVRLCPEGIAFRFAAPRHDEIWGVSMLAAVDRPLKTWSRVVKSIEDKVLAVCLLMFSAPMMALVALAIKLDSRGPIFFRQPRYGFSNEVIEVWKFRTVYHDQTDLHADTQVAKDDKRVTPVGRVLRRSSLDELPQLFNVLKGEMSIVGPRPHATRTKADGRLFEDVVLEYFARHRVKPGITGWAQVNGWKGTADTREKIQRRVEHDLYYIDRWSVWFDLRIIAMTPRAMIASSALH